jgi:hypothetical protein
LPADDADPEIAAALLQTVSGLQETHNDHEQLPQQTASASDVEPDDVESTSTPADIDLTDNESCAICHSFDDPPRDKRGELKKFSWVGCIKCPRWFHNVCVGITERRIRWICSYCADLQPERKH